MTTFSQQDCYSLANFDLVYQHPTSSDPDASLRIVLKTTGVLEKEYSLNDKPVGLKIVDGDLLIGLADHGEDKQSIQIDFSANPAYSSFGLDENPSNNRLGGFGIEDLRDASRTIGTINKHYFYLKTEPINILFSETTGNFVAEIRDEATHVTGNDTWYEVVVDTL